jgi:prevent-host-death family protein
MTSVTLTKAKARLNEYVDQCQNGPVVITQNGKAVAVLISPEDDDDLERLLLGRSKKFQALLEKSRQSIRAGKVLTSEEFWKAAAERARKRANGKAPRRRKRSAS